MFTPTPRQTNTTEYQDPEAMLAYADATSQTLSRYLPGNMTSEVAAAIAEGVVALDIAIASVTAANMPSLSHVDVRSPYLCIISRSR